MHDVAKAADASTVPNLDPGLYGLITTGVWILVLVIAALVLRRQLREVVATVLARLRAGGAIEVASLKLGALPYVAAGGQEQKPVRGIVAVTTDDGTFHASRTSFRTEMRNLFLVHKVAPSSDPEQLYDIVLYVVPSMKYGSLAGVAGVEYYFGNYWGKQIFRSIDRASGFQIATSAYAPFTCTARVSFSDGATVFLHRYVDFEMGQLPPGAFRRPET
jgi:hypothetical protein